ncbi:MAG: hypothetical protein ACYC4S_08990 [Rhodoferax sp.]
MTAEHLERGDAVPAPAAAIVARALRQYLSGDQPDISRGLGLRPRRGGTHETPLRLEQATHRNQSIQAIFEAMPGDTQKARAEQTAQLLRSPPDPQITEADVFAHLMKLYENHAGTLPTSSRQVIRIINGETVAERKK